MNENGESPADEKHLGKTLFGYEFTDVDWNQFYTYGFRCVQEYLKKGLVESSNENHLKKSRKVSIEGIDGDGVVTSWMNVVGTTELRKISLEMTLKMKFGINFSSDYNSDYTKDMVEFGIRRSFLGIILICSRSSRL